MEENSILEMSMEDFMADKAPRDVAENLGVSQSLISLTRHNEIKLSKSLIQKVLTKYNVKLIETKREFILENELEEVEKEKKKLHELLRKKEINFSDQLMLEEKNKRIENKKALILNLLFDPRLDSRTDCEKTLDRIMTILTKKTDVRTDNDESEGLQTD